MHRLKLLFYLKDNEEADYNLCLNTLNQFCSIRLRLSDYQRHDFVTLYNCQNCACIRRAFCYMGEISFGYLSPSTYILTLHRKRQCLRFLVRLPPGRNVDIILCRLNAEQVNPASKLLRFCICNLLFRFIKLR